MIPLTFHEIVANKSYGGLKKTNLTVFRVKCIYIYIDIDVTISLRSIFTLLSNIFVGTTKAYII